MNIPDEIHLPGGVKGQLAIKILEAPTKRKDQSKVVVWQLGPTNYEVHLIRPAPKGDPIYPSSNEWGSRGWTFKTEKEAIARARLLEAQETDK